MREAAPEGLKICPGCPLSTPPPRLSPPVPRSPSHSSVGVEARSCGLAWSLLLLPLQAREGPPPPAATPPESGAAQARSKVRLARACRMPSRAYVKRLSMLPQLGSGPLAVGAMAAGEEQGPCWRRVRSKKNEGWGGLRAWDTSV